MISLCVIMVLCVVGVVGVAGLAFLVNNIGCRCCNGEVERHDYDEV
jgi:hypothetical protein